jgi:hypothetical protein
MARAYGSSAHLRMKRETAYGEAATGNYIRMPFNRCNLGSEQGLIDDPVLGQGRDPLAPLQDVINDEGDIVVPVDPRYLGLWLTGLFGDPDTTDNLDGSWDHEFASGSDDLPSYTIEVGMPKVPAFCRTTGQKPFLDGPHFELSRVCRHDRLDQDRAGGGGDRGRDLRDHGRLLEPRPAAPRVLARAGADSRRDRGARAVQPRNPAAGARPGLVARPSPRHALAGDGCGVRDGWRKRRSASGDPAARGCDRGELLFSGLHSTDRPIRAVSAAQGRLSSRDAGHRCRKPARGYKAQIASDEALVGPILVAETNIVCGRNQT